ncbi:uncharacterized protein LOC113852970 [Abrus precatorius]|uniref:Uncharacterized protein LOC113852970 n=1 Tax=Abrus precatorius TaxID=3816 RepID=A0A8B8K611_ABRPR|nr:uncharacterized protein LOC113852970 [Abrus precatorius]
MEEPVKEHPSAASASASGNTARPRLQKYALRSATKSKEEKSDTPDCSNPSETKRGRGASSVSKSVSVLDFSGKDKSGSAKPPRRLSIPAKAPATSGPKLGGNITPISETRTGKSAIGQGRSKTPISDISKTSARIKLNLLTSASYWLNQIKLSESAAKHSISFGFFKLALEAGCEPLGSMQEGLKSYVSRHQLDDELGETVKELFERYGISGNTEQLQVSETISQAAEEGTLSSDDDVRSSSTMGTRKLKPKCLNIDSSSTELTPATESTKKETSQKSNPGSRLRGNFSTKTTTPRPSLDSGNRRSVRKSEKPSRQEPIKGMGKREGRKSDVKEVTAATAKGNKENMDAHTTEDISVTGVM